MKMNELPILIQIFIGSSMIIGGSVIGAIIIILLEIKLKGEL